MKNLMQAKVKFKEKPKRKNPEENNNKKTTTNKQKTRAANDGEQACNSALITPGHFARLTRPPVSAT